MMSDEFISLKKATVAFQTEMYESTWQQLIPSLFGEALDNVPNLLSEYGKRADEIIFTPQRDWQVFGGKSYSHFFGPKHAVFSAWTIGFSIIAAIPFIAKSKLFGNNEVVSLHKTLVNLRQEERVPTMTLRNNLVLLEEKAVSYLEKQPGYHLKKFTATLNQMSTQQLTHIFDHYLLEKGYNHLRSKIGLDKNNHLILEFEIYDPCFDILVEFWDITSEMTADELQFMLDPSGYPVPKTGERLFSPRYQALKTKLEEYRALQRQAALKQINYFYKHNPNGTLKECFEKRLFSSTKGSKSKQVLAWIWNILSEGCFAFWLAFEPVNIKYNNPKFKKWHHPHLVIVLIVALGFAGFKLAFTGVSNALAWFGLKKTPSNKALRQKFAKQFFNLNTIQDQLLTRLFVDCKRNDMLEKAKNSQFNPTNLTEQQHRAIKAILTATSCTQVESIHLDGHYQHNNFAFDAFDRLTKDTDPHRGNFKRLFHYAHSMLSLGILASFISWWISAIFMAAGATAIGGFLFGNPLTIGIVFAGVVAGLAYGLYSVYNRRAQKQEKKRHAALMHAQSKFNHLHTLIAQNEKLKAFIISQGGRPYTCTNAWNDNNQRRKKTNISTSYTWLKKGINRFCHLIGSMGSAVLIVRLLPMAILITAGVSMTIVNPISLTIAAILCLVWGGLCVYNYHQQSKLKEAERLVAMMDDFAIRAEKANQAIYLQQLGFDKTSRQVTATYNKPAFAPRASTRQTCDSLFGTCRTKAQSAKVESDIDRQTAIKAFRL